MWKCYEAIFMRLLGIDEYPSWRFGIETIQEKFDFMLHRLCNLYNCTFIEFWTFKEKFTKLVIANFNVESNWPTKNLKIPRKQSINFLDAVLSKRWRTEPMNSLSKRRKSIRKLLLFSVIQSKRMNSILEKIISI